jgi:hypothetical protein
MAASLLTGAGASAAAATAAQRAGQRAELSRARHHPRRVGGSVHRAWPRTGRAPRSRLARWLARQVGMTKPRPCAKRHRCKARHRRPHRVHDQLKAMSTARDTAGGDPGSPPRQFARLSAAVAPPRISSVAGTASVALPLQLVRSYEIPADDPSYARLLNWAWVYDSAVSAAAFASDADQANAQQVLDQLAALQYSDGSINIAFNTATGQASPVIRSGTSAWVGLAAATYDQDFGSTRYLDMEQRAAKYLLSLQGSSGLIKGGPDVNWVSTQHNLIAYVFLARLSSELRAVGNIAAAASYQAAATKISGAILSNLLVVDASGTHFLQGLNDTTQALDVQALGAMYLQGIKQSVLAAQVLAYAQSKFAIGNRSIKLSADPATYNLTYSAEGPFSGYAPYAGSGAPDVLWAEGSGEMRLAVGALGQDTKTLDKSISTWAKVTKNGNIGPLQADRTVTSTAYGVEYHVWPASTTAAWTVLAESSPTFFLVPPV